MGVALRLRGIAQRVAPVEGRRILQRFLTCWAAALVCGAPAREHCGTWMTAGLLPSPVIATLSIDGSGTPPCAFWLLVGVVDVVDQGAQVRAADDGRQVVPFPARGDNRT